MSEGNPTDHLVSETGKTFREILNFAAAWLARQRATSGTHAAARLTSDQRKQLADAIRAKVGERRINQAWYTKRVLDYQRLSRQTTARLSSPACTPLERVALLDRCYSMRYHIESSLHSNPTLTPAERGQVVWALGQATHEPQRKITAIFRKLTGRDYALAEHESRRSHAWVTKERDRRNGVYLAPRRSAARRPQRRPRAGARATQAPVTHGAARSPQPGTAPSSSSVTPAQQAQAQAGATATPQSQGVSLQKPVSTLIAPENMNFAQLSAVQAIRRSQMDCDVREANHRSDMESVRRNPFYSDAEKNHFVAVATQSRLDVRRHSNERAATQARKAGLPEHQIGWEFANYQANNRCQVKLSYANPAFPEKATMNSVFPDEREAAIWTRRAVGSIDWGPGTQIRVAARQAGLEIPFKLIHGAEMKVSFWAKQWAKQLGVGSGPSTAQNTAQKTTQTHSRQRAHTARR